MAPYQWKICSDCGERYQSHSSSKYCSRKCAKKYAGRVYRARRKQWLAENGGTHTPEEWQALLERHPYCVCCGTTDHKLYRDHIVPVSRGGRDDIRNIQPMCWPCNRYKAIDSTSFLGRQAVLCFCSGR